MPIAAKNESGAERKRGNERIRSSRSSGISGIVDAVRGDGRTGRVGFVSMLKDLIKDNESGIGAPLVLNGELGPPRFRRMVTVIISRMDVPQQCSYVPHGLPAVVPFGLPDDLPEPHVDVGVCS